MDLLRSAISAASDPKYSKYLAPALLLQDAILSTLVLLIVPYTEIDWKAYMEQVSLYLSGELDYVKLKGGTGPLVYPAGHVYIYSVLNKLTDQGRDIFTAQVVFTGVYLLTLGIVLAVYLKAKVPPYVLPLLVLSKRLHSIYILRLFNDSFSILLLFLSLFAYQRRLWTLGSVSYSLSVSVKMNTLLALPGVGIVLLQSVGRGRALRQASLMLQIQCVLAWPFLTANARSYLSKAFELSRVFLWQWTVNWRWLGETCFLSWQLHYALLATHLALLAAFGVTRWARPSKLPFHMFLKTYLFTWSPPTLESLQSYQLAQRITPQFILTTVLTSNLIGVLCARSLHPQFYSWIAWGTPYLLYKTGWNVVVIYLVWAAQEWAWNVFPSTTKSSLVVVSVMVAMLAGIWWETRNGEDEVADSEHRVAKKNI